MGIEFFGGVDEDRGMAMADAERANRCFGEMVVRLDSILKDGFDLNRYAAAAIGEASERGWSFEVPGRHSKSGNPVVINLENFDGFFAEGE